MDIKRKSNAKVKFIRRAAIGLVIIVAGVAITLGLKNLKPAAPSVDKGTLLFGTVKRGDMIRQVRGLGTLVPEDIVWIPAVTNARVDKIILKAGAMVKPDTLIMELSNPEAQQALLDSEAALKAAEATFADLKVKLQSDYLGEKAQAAQIHAQAKDARLQADTDHQLNLQGLVPDITAQKSATDAEELENRYKIEEERLKIAEQSIKSQKEAEQAKVDQARELYNLRRSQVDALHVRAGLTGELQLVAVEVGAQVAPGTNLARVSDPTKLKAELKIAETQAPDVAIGQDAEIDTHNGIIHGKVIRVDLAATNGTVTVDTNLEGDLPKGARPDLNVEGTITLQRLNDILYVERPVHGQENQTVGLFKVGEDGATATRVQVKFGRSSVNTIQVLDGISPGDQVILSDTSSFDNYDRIRLN